MTPSGLRKASVLCTFLALLTAAGCAGPRATADLSATAEQRYAPAALRADVDYLVAQVEAVHPAPHAFVPAGLLHRRALHVKAALDTPMTRAAFYAHVAPLIADLDDGHSWLSLPMGALAGYAESDSGKFPLDLLFAEGGVYATGSAVRSGEALVGREITAIGGVPMRTITARLLSQAPSQSRALRTHNLESGNTFAARLWLNYRFAPPFDVAYRRLDGGTAHVAVAGASTDTLRAINRQRERPPLIYRSSSDGVGVLTVRTFSDYGGRYGHDFKAVLARSFRKIRADGVRDLVIDGRGNGGGNIENVRALLGYLTPEAFDPVRAMEIRASAPAKRALKARAPALLRRLPVQFLSRRGRRLWRAEDGALVSFDDGIDPVEPRPAGERFTGARVWVLTDGGGVSAGAVFPALVKAHGLGTLVGRPTGGPDAVTFGEPITLRMPNTKLPFRLAVMRLAFGPSDAPDPGGVKPDVLVERSLRDAMRGIDTDLVRTFELIETRRATEDSNPTQ